MAAKPPTGADRLSRLRPAAPWLVAIGTAMLLGMIVAVALLRPASPSATGGSSPSVLTAAGATSSSSLRSFGGSHGGGPSVSASTLGPTQPPTPAASSGNPAPGQPTSTPRASATATPRTTSPPTPRPTPTTNPTPRPTPNPPPPGGWPKIGHIYEIVLENHELGSIIGDGSAPYINNLATRFGLATNYTAVSHPSLPNYLALWSASTQGVSDDDVHNFAKGRTLADQIEASGRRWNVAAENVPLGCFTGANASGGEDGKGDYARKHEPAISWTSVSRNAGRCAHITDFTHFNAGVGNFWFIAPNLCHDLHDCSVATGDLWLKGFLPRILGSAAYKSDGVILLTFDEGSSSIGGGGKVATIVISPKARTGFTSNHAHNHYSLVRTIEGLWSMPCMANSCSANPFREFFP